MPAFVASRAGQGVLAGRREVLRSGGRQEVSWVWAAGARRPGRLAMHGIWICRLTGSGGRPATSHFCPPSWQGTPVLVLLSLLCHIPRISIRHVAALLRSGCEPHPAGASNTAGASLAGNQAGLGRGGAGASGCGQARGAAGQVRPPLQRQSPRRTAASCRCCLPPPPPAAAAACRRWWLVLQRLTLLAPYPCAHPLLAPTRCAIRLIELEALLSAAQGVREALAAAEQRGGPRHGDPYSVRQLTRINIPADDPAVAQVGGEG